MFAFSQPTYIACTECGAAIARWDVDTHLCDPERRLDYQLERFRPSLNRFETDLREWLASSTGRFELYYLARERDLGRVAPPHPRLKAVA